ncbi:MAG: hypothetical protein F6K03_09445 [Kamptonema sp. SIO4C4]|nr:hypothetical protein [Kamptonema sp. SIO4C4]
MARKIHTRWKINGTLTAETPLHVGGMGGDADTDLALAVNGRGNYYIPGTSLAGALRGWMGRSHNESQINQLWGFQDQNSNGHASFIIVDDAEINCNNMTLEIREGVGIDRHTGAAADKAKYSRAILPKGVSFPLTITLDCQTNQEPNELWQLLRALEEGDVRIGAAKTRGLGKIKLSNIKIKKHDWSQANGLFDSLLNQNLHQKWSEIKQNLKPYNAPEKLTLKITWTPKDPVMVKTEGDGIAVDILPLVSQVTGKVHFVIPGSSIKGVLRSHAERIVRTVCNKSTSDNFLKQVKLNLVNEVFGAAEEENSKKSKGKMGALSIDDCYATIPMEVSKWSDVENAAKSNNEEFTDFQNTLKNALEIPNHENPFRKLQPAMHVAVDRWTGGAAEGMLYSVLEPIGVEWGQIGINLDLERLKKYGEGNVQPAIALLLLVLRDFANRKIPIGYGTNRGMGTVEVTDLKIKGLEGVEDGNAIAPDLSNLGNDLLLNLTKAWKDWITENKEAA